MTTLSHRQVLSLFHLDTPLDEEHRAALDDHLMTCDECRAYGNLVSQLEKAPWSPYQKRGFGISDERRLTRNIQARIRRRRKIQRVLSPVPTTAWLAAAILLMLVLSWTITNLLPGEGMSSPAVSGSWEVAPRPVMPSIPLSPSQWEVQEPDMVNVFNWLWKYAPLTLLALPVLIGMAGMVFGVRAESKKSALGWLIFLLTALVFLICALLATVPWDGYGVVVWLLPAILVAVAALLLHLWSTPGIWSRETATILLVSAIIIAVLLVGPWWPEWYRSTYMIFLLALPPAVIWQAGEWRGWPRRIVLGILSLLVVVVTSFFLIPAYTVSNLPAWVGVIFEIGKGLWVVVGVILVARLIYNSLSGQWPFLRPADRWKIIGLLALMLLILFSVRALIVLATIGDLTSEEGTGAMLLAVLSMLAATVVAIPMSWGLPGWRKVAAPVFLSVVMLVLVPAPKPPQITAPELTEQRAERVNQAVLRYYEQNGRYPESLTALSPWYLYNIPAPVTKWDHNFCYQGGDDYYRLGYISQVNPRMIKDFFLEIHASVGETPAPAWECDAELERAREREAEYWGR